VLLRHPSTTAWLTAFDFGGVPAGSAPWGANTKDVRYHRIITGISGNIITVDAPLFMDFRKSLSQCNIIKFNNAWPDFQCRCREFARHHRLRRADG